jgi:hypothetical protein
MNGLPYRGVGPGALIRILDEFNTYWILGSSPASDKSLNGSGICFSLNLILMKSDRPGIRIGIGARP